MIQFTDASIRAAQPRVGLNASGSTAALFIVHLHFNPAMLKHFRAAARPRLDDDAQPGVQGEEDFSTASTLQFTGAKAAARSDAAFASGATDC